MCVAYTYGWSLVLDLNLVLARTAIFSHPWMILALLSILILSLTLIMLRKKILQA